MESLGITTIDNSLPNNDNGPTGTMNDNNDPTDLGAGGFDPIDLDIEPTATQPITLITNDFLEAEYDEPETPQLQEVTDKIDLSFAEAIRKELKQPFATGSSISIADILTVIMFYFPTYNMSATQIDGFFILLQFILGAVSVQNILPRNRYMFEKDNSYFNKYEKRMYCEKHKCLTNECKHGCTLKHFWYRPLKDILHERWQCPNFRYNAGYYRRRLLSADVVEDVYDAGLYQKYAAPITRNAGGLSVSVNTDGTCPFTAGTSYWPIILVIHELPPTERYKAENLLLAGLWSGNPDFDIFFQPLLQDLIDLKTHGMNVNLDGEDKVCKVATLFFIGDMPARAKVMKMVGSNSTHHACTRCLAKGQSVSHRTLLPYSTDATVQRTNNNTKQCVESSLSDGAAVYGITGKNFLMYVHNDYSIQEHTVIENMHTVFSNFVKNIMSYMRSTLSEGKAYHISSEGWSSMCEVVGSLRFPYTYHRQQGSLENFDKYRISQHRMFLLYTWPILLDTFHNETVRRPIMRVIEVIRELSDCFRRDRLPQLISDMKEARNEMQQLFGTHIVTLPVHEVMEHLVQCCEQWGPLYVTTMFSLEGFNHNLQREVHGTKSVEKRALEMVSCKHLLPRLTRELQSDEAKQAISKLQRKNGNKRTWKPVLYSHKQQAIGWFIFPDAQFQHRYKKAFLSDKDGCYFKVYSRDYYRDGNHLSYCVCVEIPGNDGVVTSAYAFVNHFLLDMDVPKANVTYVTESGTQPATDIPVTFIKNLALCLEPKLSNKHITVKPRYLYRYTARCRDTLFM